MVSSPWGVIPKTIESCLDPAGWDGSVCRGVGVCLPSHSSSERGSSQLLHTDTDKRCPCIDQGACCGTLHPPHIPASYLPRAAALSFPGHKSFPPAVKSLPAFCFGAGDPKVPWQRCSQCGTLHGSEPCSPRVMLAVIVAVLVSPLHGKEEEEQGRVLLKFRVIVAAAPCPGLISFYPVLGQALI